MVSVWASLVVHLVKNPPVILESWVRSLGWEDPLEEGMAHPFQYSCLENPHGRRNLAGCSPWNLRVRCDGATDHTAHGFGLKCFCLKMIGNLSLKTLNTSEWVCPRKQEIQRAAPAALLPRTRAGLPSPVLGTLPWILTTSMVGSVFWAESRGGSKV